jgi:hypothetical protein
LPPVVCRTLRREYRLYAPTAAIRSLLQFVAAMPELPGTALEPLDLPIATRDCFLSTAAPGGEPIEGTPDYLIHAVHRLLLADLVESEPGAPLIHGATVRIEGRRFLLIGHSGCGKSTLALHLAISGCEVEGDEHLLVREDEVIARPRMMRVKEGSLELVAGLPGDVWRAPAIRDWEGALIRAVHPGLGQRPWVIRAGRLDALVLLRANHGGRSVARAIGSSDAFEGLMTEILLPQAGISAAAGRLRRLAVEVPAFQLLLGDLTTAEWHLRKIAVGLT